MNIVNYFTMHNFINKRIVWGCTEWRELAWENKRLLHSCCEKWSTTVISDNLQRGTLCAKRTIQSVWTHRKWDKTEKAALQKIKRNFLPFSKVATKVRENIANVQETPKTCYPNRGTNVIGLTMNTFRVSVKTNWHIDLIQDKWGPTMNPANCITMETL